MSFSGISAGTLTFHIASAIGGLSALRVKEVESKGASGKLHSSWLKANFRSSNDYIVVVGL